MKRTLTHAEALAIFADESADSLPFRVLNAAGQQAVAQFVDASASAPETHNLDAWYSDAENAANDAATDEAIVIEMRGMHTANGNPATATLAAEHFDWVI